jgi:general secretion pathway protein I
MTNRSIDKPVRGFTLIEVLVALTILSVTLAALLSVFGSGLQRAAAMRSSTRAMSLAQSLLATTAQGTPPSPGDTAGEFVDGFRWRMRVAPYAEQKDADEWPVRALQVAVEVSWTDGGRIERKVTLDTLRLAPKESR